MHLNVTKTDPFADAEIVTSLLSRQDEVIAELDLLDAQVLSVIEEVTAQRESSEEVTIKLPLEGKIENSQNDSIDGDSDSGGDSQFQKAA